MSVGSMSPTRNKPHRVQAITLDLDNTLWDIFPVVEKAEVETYRWIQNNFPRVAELCTLEDLRNLRDEIYFTRTDIQHDLTEIRRVAYARVLEQAGYTDNGKSQELAEFFVWHRNQVELYPDVPDALEQLSAKFPIVALTDGNADLEVIGINKYFLDNLSAAKVGATKPDSKGFLMACELTGTKPKHTLHVGDHPNYDVFGAQNAGLQAMWIRRNNEVWNEPFRPDYCVDSLEQAVEILC